MVPTLDLPEPPEEGAIASALISTFGRLVVDVNIELLRRVVAKRTLTPAFQKRLLGWRLSFV